VLRGTGGESRCEEKRHKSVRRVVRGYTNRYEEGLKAREEYHKG
jgi:hypothetical protein